MQMPTDGVLRSLIGGEWVDGADRTLDVNPTFPDEPVAEVALADADTAERAVAVAAAAAPGWARTPAPARGAILHRIGDLLERRAEEIGFEIAREEGKTAAEGTAETRRASQVFHYFAGHCMAADGSTFPSAKAGTLIFSRRVPLGVVAAITPWNFPIAIPAWKLAPALAYGNAVVWKPAELVPLTSVRLAEAMLDGGLPEGVCNLVLGRGSVVGSTLLASEAVDGITFTGSNAIGGQIADGARLDQRVQLELGGKNPAVVLADADLDQAARTIANAAFLSAGQKCTATSRVVVERAVAEPFTELLRRTADAMAVGDPSRAETRIGPLVSADQRDSVLGYVEKGEAEGRRAGSRGAEERPPGFFVDPIVFVDLPDSSPLLSEEIFGPVVAVTVVEDLDQAIATANGTRFGLSAAIFTRNLAAALRFAEESQTGIVKVNGETSGVEPQVPFGGTKGSGSGPQEQGPAAVEFFTHWKSVYIDPLD